MFSFSPMRVFANTVKVDESKVTVQEGQNTTVVQQAPPVVAATPVVVQAVPVVVTEQDPRHVEGEIINVDIPENQILVRDIDNREKRIQLKQGMISNYKVGDYVEVYLMADMKEAKTIETHRIADLEGEIVTLDYTNKLLILRESSGNNRSVLIRPALIQQHKVGDRVRMYVVQAEPDPSTTVRLIRVT